MPKVSKPLRVLLIVLLLLGVGFILARILVAQSSRSSVAQGINNGRLAPCPSSPNCVSSRDTDELHGMLPLSYTGDTAVARDNLLQILNDMPNATIITNELNYIHAEFHSPIWQFVDDVEFQIDENSNEIHFRSASRLGYSDLDANRKRMEEIRAAYNSVNQ